MEPLRLYTSRLPIIGLVVALLATVVAYAAFAMFAPIQYYVVAAWVAVGSTAFVSCLLMLRLLRPRRPCLEIDATGVRSPIGRIDIPWSEVRLVRITGPNGSVVEVVSKTSYIRILIEDLPGGSAQPFLAYAKERNPRISMTLTSNPQDQAH